MFSIAKIVLWRRRIVVWCWKSNGCSFSKTDWAKAKESGSYKFSAENYAQLAWKVRVFKQGGFA